MGATEAQAAGDNAAAQDVDNKSTTTNPTPGEETKGTESLDTNEADKEVAKDLLEDESDEDSKESEEDDDESKEDKSKDDDVNAEREKGFEEADEQERSKGAEARKEKLQNEIRELVSKRNEARKQYEEEISKHYRTETVEELEEKGLSPEEAENEVLRQELQMKDFNQRVADLNGTLNIEALQVMQDFPVFDPDSSDYDKDFSSKVRALYEKAAQPVIDEKTGLVLRSNITPYEFYKAFADVRTSTSTESRVQGEVEGKRAADKETAAAEIQTSAPPKAKKDDPFLAGLLSNDD